MGLLRICFEQGDIRGCREGIQALWASRHNNNTFSDADADDAVWLLDRTQGSPNWQRQLWPKLLGLLTRWAYLARRLGPSGSAGKVPYLQALQCWLAERLVSISLPWGARGAALLLIAVIACSVPDSSVAAATQQHAAAPSTSPQLEQLLRLQPQQHQQQPLLYLACQSILSELRRPPTAHLLLDSPDAVTDLCTAVELVLERLAIKGDWGSLVSLLAALLAALGGAISELVNGGSGGSNSSGGLADGSRRSPIQPVQRSDVRSAVLMTAAAAAAQESAAAALAALHASCRQMGSTCARAVAATAAAATTAGRTAVGGSTPRAAAAAFASIASQLHTAAGAAATAAGTATVAVAAMAGTVATAHSSADPRIRLSVAATAAGGLLEGCAMTVRLQPLGEPQENLLRLLQPGADLLAGTLQEAAGAMAAAAAAVSVKAEASVRGFGGSYSPCTLDPNGDPWVTNPRPRVAVLDMALGYCWSRLRAQPPLPGPLQPAARAAELMMAAAVSDMPFWHPARGALAVLMVGSLGLGRVLQLAVAGESADSAVELLEGQFRGPLFADTQLLAKTVVEVVRTPAPAPEPAAVAAAPPSAATCMYLASALLSDAAAAARRLNLLYGSAADTASGRAWLAGLPSSAAGCIRELLDRAFACEVSVLAAAYGMLSTAPPIPLVKTVATPGGAATGSGKDSAMAQVARDEQARAAAAALGVLGDLQFCALQLRIHGDLVARLSADALSSPAAALPPLLALLPCYSAFASAYGSGGDGGFAAVPVAASRLTFLLPLAASCMPHAEDLGAAAYVVLPYIYLLLKGAPDSVVQASHATWAALLSKLCENELAVATDATSVRRLDGASSTAADGGRGRAGPPLMHGRGVTVGSGEDGVDALAGEKEERRNVGEAVAASMVPYYIARTCQEPCSEGDLELLEWGVRQALQSLPEVHPMKAWCAARLIRQLREWATACEVDAKGPFLPIGPLEREGSAPVATSGGHDQESSATMKCSNVQALTRRCAAVVAAVVMALDFRLIPQALGCLMAELQTLRSGGGLILQQLHDVWLSCHDYGRKQLLEDWFRHVLLKMHIRAKL